MKSLPLYRWALLAACSAALGSTALAQTPVATCDAAVGNSGATIPAAGGAFLGATGSTRNTFTGTGCGSSSNPGANVWYNWTPAQTGIGILELCNSPVEFDAVLSVYSTCPTSTVSNSLACGDDDCGDLETLPRVQRTFTGGTTYYIRVANYSGLTSNGFRLDVTAPSTVGNDECAPVSALATTSGPYAFTGTGFTANGHTALATTSAGTSLGTCGLTGGDSSNNPANKNDLYYKFTPSVSTNYNITLCSSASNWDSILSLHAGCPVSGANQIVCNDDGVCSGDVGLSAITNQPLDAGTPYMIRVSTYTAGTPSAFTLTVSSDPTGTCCTPTGSCSLTTAAGCTGGNAFNAGATCSATPCPAANDTCSMATVISSVPFTSAPQNLSGATADQDISCNSSASAGTDFGVWFTYTATTTGTIALGQPSGPDTATAVFTGTCGALTEIACSDPSSFNFSATAGTQYYILVGVWSAGDISTTPLVLTLDTVAAIANDTCESATVVNTSPYSSSPILLSGATSDPDVSCNSTSATVLNNGVWFTYTATASGNVVLNQPQGPDTATAVFTGACGGLTEIACSDPANFNFAATAGTQYYILIGAWGSSPSTSTTPMVFTLEVIVPISNDVCGTASVIPSLPFTDAYQINRASADIDVSCNSDTATGANNSAWWTYTATTASALTFSDDDVTDTVLAAFTGSCGSLTQIACNDEPQKISIVANPGTQYYFMTAVYSATPSGSSSTIAVSLVSSAIPSVPANDTCANATAISSLPFDSGNVNNFLATDDDSVTCNLDGVAARQGLWFTYTPSSDCIMSLSESGPLDTVKTIFTGSCGSLVETECFDAELGSLANLSSGTQYFILVSIWNNTASTAADDYYRLQATCSMPVANDLCSNATPISVGQTVTGGTATVSGTADSDCTIAERDVWYVLNASVAGNYTFAGSVPSGTDTDGVALALFDACGGNELDCDNPGFGTTTLNISLSAGQTVYLRVARYADATTPDGTGIFSVTLTGPASADSTCCRGTTCTLTSSGSCTAPAGVGVSFVSASSTCNASGTNTSPCCYADFNKDGSRNIDDIFIYLNAWFGTSSNPYTKIGGDGVTNANIDDLFIFINVWFAGGCG
jgi:hypothetical protein